MVLSVDSAYHFDPRTTFLRQAHALLEPGGRLVLTDIVRADGATSTAFGAWMMEHAFELPRANWVDRATYVGQLVAAGFADVEVTVLDDHVFPGLAAFIDRQTDAWHSVTGALPWAPFLATAAGLRSIYASRSMHFVLVSARKT